MPAKAGIQYAGNFRFITAGAAYWIVRRSLSSGGHSADPVAGDDTASEASLWDYFCG